MARVSGWIGPRTSKLFRVRATLLPREVAARVITGSTARVAWSAGALMVVLAIPVLVENLLMKDALDAIPVPLAMLFVMLALIAVALRWTTTAVTVAYLVIAGAAALVYEVSLLQNIPSMGDGPAFVLNRPTLALVTIGVVTTSAAGSILWAATGFAVATAVSVLSAIITGTPFNPGWGPAMILALSAVLYSTLFAIQARQRRRLPGFEELEAATLRRSASANLAQRSTALVHDTVLNDLTVVMNGPDVLDERARNRLTDDLETLEGPDWARTTQTVAVHDEAQARIRNALTEMTSEFRWRGLNVGVTGARGAIYSYSPEVADALLGAIRAALENILRHSGTNSADIEVVYRASDVTFIITDQGRGFDTSAVDPARLGVRGSIVARMTAVGGSARIWSSPGSGTTVLITAPVFEVLAPPDPPDHQRGDHADPS
ncbi:sensor histidine kinase [Homoserinibacter sp. GY 40078]|uniref:sensor histidine kinase n=1 Tax=Homoserinibacter sp. GY 40078 TaxID=2603275 RepID=UPI0011C99CAF|nr:ATP-binding protein [Homoserinibacter sp. GY 40078]TXK19566.1 hypothetical protein FVQ89_06745 [Homoserinibacter sp. GY 40078]